MTSRREFLVALSGLGGLSAPWMSGSPTVHVQPTIFHGHPDGRTTLLRFFVRELTAPAGRLRVYGRNRQLLGTAGVLPAGDGLYGELWLPLDRSTTLTTELEAPGLRGVRRDYHTVDPQRRWTIHWLTVVDPDTLRAELTPLGPERRAARVALYRAAGIRANPLLSTLRREGMDHIPFLRLTLPAAHVESDLGVIQSPVALLEDWTELAPNVAMALKGAGVQAVAVPERHAAASWWPAADGSALPVFPLPAGSDPAELGFADGLAEMARRVERWLTALAVSQRNSPGTVLVIGNAPSPAPAMYTAVRQWNTRFAYPRIVTGSAPAPPRESEPNPTPLAQQVTTLRRPLPLVHERVAGLADARARMLEERVNGLITPLATHLGKTGLATMGLASALRASFPGTLVINTTPFTRTDVVRLRDGTSAIVTDVPPLGYAFVVESLGDTGQAAREAELRPDPSTRFHGRDISLQIDSRSGAIQSVLDADGRERVRTGVGGLNGVDGTVLENLTVQRISNVGTQLTAQRRTLGGERLTTTYRLYDGLPWLDVENEAGFRGGGVVEYRFPYRVDGARMSWDVPAGERTGTPPIQEFAHLRWMLVEGDEDRVFVRGFDAPLSSVTSEGTVVSHAPTGRCNYRLAFDRKGRASMPPWRFGWETEPLVSVPVPRAGSGLLPTAASLLLVDQRNVSVLGIKTADNGDGVIVYLRNHDTLPQLVSVQPGLLQFEDARRVDLVERDIGPVDGTLGEGILVRIASGSVAVVRLVQLSVGG